MTKNIFERILNRIYTAWIVPLREKKYYGDVQKEPLKYLFFPKKSSILVVGFQAFHDTEARYNYVSTLRGCPVSRLYIKDDSASDGRGSYYLGRHGTYSVETLCAELIDRCAKACGATKLVFIGSSKGGYGALNFGIRYPGSDMIIAAPQYYLGNYLNSGRNRSALVDILGREDYSAAEFEQLNFRLKERILADPFAASQTVHLHYSDSEHTYQEHVRERLLDREAAGITVRRDVGHYTAHEDLRYFYPAYLKREVEGIIRLNV